VRWKSVDVLMFLIEFNWIAESGSRGIGMVLGEVGLMGEFQAWSFSLSICVHSTTSECSSTNTN
jgi:hypothetical protein